MLLAVNGTLMRGLDLNQNLLDVGAEFNREAQTAPCYQLWSINDCYPGMIRANARNGVKIALEIWEIDAAGLINILEHEPPGLTVGRVLLENGEEILGVLAEPYLVQGKAEITTYGGWRNYINANQRK